MVKRIQKLVVEARNHALEQKRIYDQAHKTEQCVEDYRNEYNTKFFELIIGECMINLSKVWYEQGLDIRGASIGEFLKRFEDITIDSQD